MLRVSLPRFFCCQNDLPVLPETSFSMLEKSSPVNPEPSVPCVPLLTERCIFRRNCCFAALLREQIKARFVPLFPSCCLSDCLRLKAFAWLEPGKFTRSIWEKLSAVLCSFSLTWQASYMFWSGELSVRCLRVPVGVHLAISPFCACCSGASPGHQGDHISKQNPFVPLHSSKLGFVTRALSACFLLGTGLGARQRDELLEDAASCGCWR